MITKKEFTAGTVFYDAESGEEYKHYFFNLSNNYIMTLLGLEVYLVTKITPKGYYYRGFVRLNDGLLKTDLFMPFKQLKKVNKNNNLC